MINLVIGIHGMVPNREPVNPAKEMDEFLAKVFESGRNLPHVDFHALSWGHQPLGNSAVGLRPDQHLTKAQKAIADLTTYDNVKSARSPQNEVQSDIGSIPYIRDTKDTVCLFGLPDVVYYCSPDGEKAVRTTIAQQLTEFLTPLFYASPGEPVRLHIVAHSLGGGVSHDLLYNLFSPNANPKEDNPYIPLRALIAQHGVEMGAWITIETQIPLFMMRTQALVDRFFNNEKLDLVDIGLHRDNDKIRRWLNIYERDDLLGFPATALYKDPQGVALQYQADVSFRPDKAHSLSSYTNDAESMKRIREVMFANLS